MAGRRRTGLAVAEKPREAAAAILSGHSGDRKGLNMELKLVPRRHLHLATCSLCLRVRQDSDWIDAEAVIRQLRTYELGSLPHFEPAVCDDCLAAILARRAEPETAIAA